MHVSICWFTERLERRLSWLTRRSTVRTLLPCTRNGSRLKEGVCWQVTGASASGKTEIMLNVRCLILFLALPPSGWTTILKLT